MVKDRRQHRNRIVAIVASIALVVGLMPLPAAAASGIDPEGQAPGTAPAVEVVVSADAPEVSEGEAVEVAVDGAPAAVQGGEAEAQEAAAEKAEEAAASQAGDPTAAEKAEAKAGEAEKADVAEKAEAAEKSEKAKTIETPGKAEEGAEPAKVESPAFRQSSTVGGVAVTVEAGAGAFPEGARLSVVSVSSSRTEAAVAPVRGADQNVAASYTFDVKVLGADGAELQPAAGKSVNVSFKAAEVADPNLDVSVYHVSGGEAEELAVSESGSTATAKTDGFSYYTVEFTYNNLQYVLPGGSEVALADILAEVGLEGVPTDAVSSNPELFGVEERSGAWTVAAKQAFTSVETLTVTINGQNYEIAVTDSSSGTCGENLTWTLSDSGTLTISGTGEMYNYASDNTPWFDERDSIKFVEIRTGVTSIGSFAFRSCTRLLNVTIQDSVTSIGDCAFNDCEFLHEIRIPDSVTSIGNSAFAGCISLGSITIGKNVSTIEPYAFALCGFESVTIPESVTTIEKGAFSYSRLEDIFYAGSKDKWEELEKGQDWDEGTPEDMVIHYNYNGEEIVKIRASENPWWGGTVSNDHSYVVGEKAALVATPDAGFTFVNWTEDEEVVSTEADYRFTAEKNRRLTANFKKPVTITAKDQNATYNGKPQGESDTVYDDPSRIAALVDVEGLQSGHKIVSIELFWQGTDAGTSDVEVQGAVVKDANGNDVTYAYAIDYIDGTLIIEPAEVTVTTGSADKVYDGEPLTNDEASITGLVEGETATVTATGSQTDVGSSANTYSIKWGSAKAENYTVTEKLGTLTVEAAPVKEYTVTFVNWDGTVLQSGKVAEGEVPKYTGADPTRPETDQYLYVFQGWDPEVVAVTGDATYTAKYTATPKDKPAYKVVSGAGGTWTAGSNAPMTFKIERTVDPETAFAHFAGVLVDGKAVPEKDASGKANWTARSGSVIVELQPSYLATLSAGKHTVTVTFDDADPVSADFTVSAKAATPATGDSLPGATVVLIVVALVALGAAIAAFVVRRRIRG